jgi:hypothetical protein
VYSSGGKMLCFMEFKKQNIWKSIYNATPNLLEMFIIEGWLDGRSMKGRKSRQENGG